MAINTAGTAGAHAIQSPIGNLTHTPHGFGISALLPYVMRYNLPTRVPEFAEIGRILGVADASDSLGDTKHGRPSNASRPSSTTLGAPLDLAHARAPAGGLRLRRQAGDAGHPADRQQPPRVDRGIGDGDPRARLRRRPELVAAVSTPPVAVLGAGSIGVSFAILFACNGFDVTVYDPFDEALPRAEADLRERLWQFAGTRRRRGAGPVHVRSRRGGDGLGVRPGVCAGAGRAETRIVAAGRRSDRRRRAVGEFEFGDRGRAGSPTGSTPRSRRASWSAIRGTRPICCPSSRWCRRRDLRCHHRAGDRGVPRRRASARSGAPRGRGLPVQPSAGRAAARGVLPGARRRGDRRRRRRGGAQRAGPPLELHRSVRDGPT